MINYTTINLEAGMPTVDRAIFRLTYELNNAKRIRMKAMKIIHGYGSSGKGGKLRIELRRYLARVKARGGLSFYIEGERFSIFDEDSRKAFEICPELRADRDLERHNNGVTIILL